MTAIPLGRRLAAEALATGLLLATIIGSGIMAERLSGGNVGVALLGNTLATGAMLVVLILIFGPVSGAHMNPAVSLAMTLRGRLPRRDLAPYILAQVAGALIGVGCAHLMFDLPLLQLATTVRSGPPQWLAEFVATFGLVLTIFGCLATRPAATPGAVGLYIVAGYWYTASTCFANPVVTLARSLSDSFAGIAPGGVAPFVLAQLLGMLAGVWVAARLFEKPVGDSV